MEQRAYEIFSSINRQVSIKVICGHFATQHSHITHYVDMTQVKSQMTAAKAAAKILASHFTDIPVDTIITLDRMKMVGAFMAEELSSGGINSKQNISVFSPEISGDKMILRDNFLPYIKGRHVLILTDSATTGLSIKGVTEGIGYYGGMAVGSAAIFGGDFPINIPFARIFDMSNIDKYCSYGLQECPLCKNGIKVDAVVNSYGYSKII